MCLGTLPSSTVEYCTPAPVKFSEPFCLLMCFFCFCFLCNFISEVICCWRIRVSFSCWYFTVRSHDIGHDSTYTVTVFVSSKVGVVLCVCMKCWHVCVCMYHCIHVYVAYMVCLCVCGCVRMCVDFLCGFVEQMWPIDLDCGCVEWM